MASTMLVTDRDRIRATRAPGTEVYIVANSQLKAERIPDSPPNKRTTFLVAPSQVAQSGKRKLEDDIPPLDTIFRERKQIKFENREIKVRFQNLEAESREFKVKFHNFEVELGELEMRT